MSQSTLKDCALATNAQKNCLFLILPVWGSLPELERCPLTTNAITHMDIYGYRDSPSASQSTLKDCSLATKEVGKECKKMPLFDPPSVGQSTLKDCSLSRPPRKWGRSAKKNSRLFLIQLERERCQCHWQPMPSLTWIFMDTEETLPVCPSLPWRTAL